MLAVEGDDARVDSKYVAPNQTSPSCFSSLSLGLRMIKDERVKEDPSRSLFNQDFTDRVGI